MIIVDANEIKSMCEEGRLSINMKPQRSGQGNNYLFNPELGITFRNVQVIEVNAKYVIFRLSQSDGEDSLCLGRHLQNYLKRSYFIQDTVPFYNIINKDNNDEYVIRCYLPQLKGKSALPLPKSEHIDTITLEIKNVWHLPDKLGFNVELRRLN